MEGSPQQNAAAQAAAQVQAMLANAGGNIAKAFVGAWGEIPAVVEKDANNPHYGNDYATLEAVEKLVKPILAKYRLAFPQTPGVIVDDKIEVVGMLVHESGERWVFKTEMPLGGKLTAQAAGSATTYARRYQLLAVFGIAPTDDDGEASSAPPTKQSKPKTEKKAKGEDAPYADQKEALLTAIREFTGTPDELSTALKARVEELADADINAVYVEKRRQLKTGAKGK